MQLNETIAIIEEIKNKEVAIPISYQKAVSAIQECDAIDEAKDWADKMSALALYYKQSKDKTLEKYAKRIKYRAKRRMGELLKQFDAKGKRNDLELSTVTDTKLTQKEVSENIGLSKRQKDQSVRLSNIPEATFNEMVESENVPTLTQLAELGIKKNKTKPNNISKVLSIKYALKDLIKEMNDKDPIYVLDALDIENTNEILEMIKTVENWFDTFVVNCDTV